MTEHTLKNQLTEQMKQAMRGQMKDRLRVIRMILAEIKRVEVDERIDPDDARIISILDKMAKQRRDSIEQFAKADRQDLVDQENFELTVLQEFLPTALSEDEIVSLIQDAVNSSGAQSMQDMGKVMAVLKPKLQGRADMATVSQLVKAQLSS